MSETVKPRYLNMDISTRCQLSCPACPNGRGTLAGPDVGIGDMEFSDFKALLENNPNLAGIEIGNWGEPLLNPELGSFLEFADCCGVGIILNTNLNQRRNGLMGSIVKNRVRAMVCSLDGATQESYETYRVGGNLEAAVENAAEITKLKMEIGSPFPRLIWKFIVFGHNEHEITLARKMAKGLGMEFQLALPIDLDIGVGADIECAFSPPRNTEQLRNELGYTTYEEFGEVLGFYPWHGACIQLWEQPVVNWNGDMLGCCNSQNSTGGNAFRDGLQLSVNTTVMRHARAMVSGREPDRGGVFCSRCTVYSRMNRTGNWLKLSWTNRTANFFIRHLATPHLSERLDAFVCSHLQRRLELWHYWYIPGKFSLADLGLRVTSAEGPDLEESCAFRTPEMKESDTPRTERHRADIPIVVVLYHREEETRMMFEQLARVTDGYSLIIVNNGFDDSDFIRGLNPLHYIENEENTGAIRGINQGLELAEEEYAAVLHNDILIYEEGWLDHIIEFMERREDVGLVGLGGWHSVSAGGLPTGHVADVDREGWRPGQPVWRFTEVAAIDGTGWVTRSGAAGLDTRFGDDIRTAALDISLHCREEGMKVHCVALETSPLPGRDDPVSMEAGKALAEKWKRLLPVCREYVDEKRSLEEIERLSKSRRYPSLQEERARLGVELEEIAIRARRLETEIGDNAPELSRLSSIVEQRRARPAGGATDASAARDECDYDSAEAASPSGLASRFIHLARTHGLYSAVKRSLTYARRKAGSQ